MARRALVTLAAMLGFGLGAAVPLRPLVALWDLPRASSAAEFPAPRVVLYDDGTVIAERVPGRAGTAPADPADSGFITVQLNQAELGSWLEDVYTVTRNEELKAHYALDPAGDRIAWMHFFSGDTVAIVSVLGLTAQSLNAFGVPKASPVTEIPSRLLRLYQHLNRFGNGQSWVPVQVELTLTPGIRGTATAFHWPAHWPRPMSAGANRYTALLGRREWRELATAPVQAGARLAIVETQVMTVRHRFLLPGADQWDVYGPDALALTQAAHRVSASDDHTALHRHYDAQARAHFKQLPTQAAAAASPASIASPPSVPMPVPPPPLPAR